MINMFDNLKSIKIVENENDTYNICMRNGKVYVISETNSFINLLYSDSFNKNYEYKDESLDNIFKYNWKIVEQKLK